MPRKLFILASLSFLACCQLENSWSGWETASHTGIFHRSVSL